MDIDAFYEGDPRRRPSAEIELGTGWHDADDVQYELNWVHDTGELYVMREAAPRVSEDPFGGLHVRDTPGFEHQLTVHVVAHIDTADNLHKILDGWAEAMAGPDGPGWLGDRLRAASVAVGSDDPIGDGATEVEPG
jgi:hypothetical protein